MRRRVVFAFPGRLDTPTGGYAYDRRMMQELRALGWDVVALSLGEGFPLPSDATRAQAASLLQKISGGEPIIVDGLAFGVMADESAALQREHPLVALVHHPLALETGLTPRIASAMRESEIRALAAATTVVVTSETTAALLARDYRVARSRIAVAVPGTDIPVPRRRASRAEIQLLAVGAVVPRKGYDGLLDALCGLPDLPWQLTIVGALDRAPHTAEALQEQLIRLGLQDRVALAGAVADDILAAHYAAADVFVLASHFEGYGMAFTEAIAHGLPVIGTNAGAVAQTVPADAAILVPPGDIRALADALRSVIGEQSLRQRMADAASRAASSLPQWRASAEVLSRAIEQAMEAVT